MKTFTLFVLSALCAVPVNAQGSNQRPSTRGQQLQFSARNSVFIRELAAVVSEEEGKIVVKFVPPADRRSSKTSDVDIEVGDEIGMANGTRIRNIADFRKLYQETGEGSELRIGIRREGRNHIITFTKESSGDAAGGMTMIGGGEAGSQLLSGLGVTVQQRGNAVVIGQTMQNAPEGLQKGDQIEAFNGATVETVAELVKAFDALDVGEELTFSLVRNGTKASVTAKKPEPSRQMIMRVH